MRAVAIVMVFGAIGCRQILGIDPGTVQPPAGDGAPVDFGSEVLPDDAPDDGLVIDMPPDSALGVWGNIELVDHNNNGDDDPTLTADMLELYFNRSDDIYVMKRTTVASNWTAPTLVTELSDPQKVDTSPEISPNGLSIMFGSNRDANQNDIYRSVRANRTAAWGTPLKVTDLSASATNEAPGTISDDNKHIVMTSDRDGGDFDIFEATRSGLLFPFDPPQLISTVSSVTADQSPFMSGDGLELYFDSNRGGNDDIYRATRSTITGTWSVALPIPELSTGSGDTDPWISPDGHDMYFASARMNGSRLYHASR